MSLMSLPWICHPGGLIPQPSQLRPTVRPFRAHEFPARWSRLLGKLSVKLQENANSLTSDMRNRVSGPSRKLSVMETSSWKAAYLRKTSQRREQHRAKHCFNNILIHSIRLFVHDETVKCPDKVTLRSDTQKNLGPCWSIISWYILNILQHTHGYL